MPVSDVAKKLIEFLRKAPTNQPKLTGSALGALAGGTAGGLFSEEGATTRGALQGALLGSGAGLGVSALRDLPIVASAVGASIPVGLLGRRKLSPLRAEELREQREERKAQRRKKGLMDNPPKVVGELELQAAYNSKHKENALMSAKANLEFLKQATNKSAVELEKTAEQILSFDVGMDIFCQNSGISKAALARPFGLTEQELAVATITALMNRAEHVSQ